MKTIERVIITALLRDMRAAGYQPAAVWDGGDYVMARPDGSCGSREKAEVPARIVRALLDEEAFEVIDSVDDCTLHFTNHNAQTWGNRGVMIVLGNGEDVISDYHSPSGEAFTTIIDAITGRLDAGLVP